MYMQKSIANSLPVEILSALTATEIKLLEILKELCIITSKRSPSGAYYCFPSEEWLGRRVGASREWVSKSVGKLQRAGLIQITRRRKEKGVWKTNLYRIGNALWACFKRLSHCVNGLFGHVNSTSHIVKKPHFSKSFQAEKVSNSIKNRGPDLSEIISRLSEKMGF